MPQGWNIYSIVNFQNEIALKNFVKYQKKKKIKLKKKR